MNPRVVAARVLQQVIGEGRSLTAVLLQSAAEPHKALVQELCYGTLRWYPRLDVMLGRLLHKPLKAKDGDVRALLLLGLYQLFFMRVAGHAAVDETVDAAVGLDKVWAKGVVNAVLRNAQRRREELDTAVAAVPEAYLAHPAWLLERLQADWPAQWEAIATANNERPPMTLRVNARRSGRDAYLDHLAAAGLPAHACAHAPTGVILEQAVAVESLPGFAAGEVSVQDGAAQLAATLLDLRDGQRVLDVCAAPGGKTAHILEAAPLLAAVWAVDVDAARLARVAQTLARLNLHAHLCVGDAAQPAVWWDGEPFDRILLDAPCSATGVIRRHPDIKVLRKAADIASLVAAQRRILAAVWPLLRPGGLLVYATCSVLRDENERQMAWWLASQPQARERVLPATWGHAVAVGRQILPGEQDMDGFYYACIEKQ